MRIGIDCRLSGKKHAGLGRYTENLVQQLLCSNEEPRDSYVLFFFSAEQAQEVIPSNATVAYTVVLTPIPHYSLKEQFVLPFYLYKEKIDLLHVPHFNCSLLYSGKIVVTIHDLLWHEKRGGSVTTLSPFQYWIKYFFYHVVTTAAIIKAKHIFVPSETVQKTVIKYYPKTEHKISVTKEGTSLQKPKKLPLRKKEKLLYVGSLYPHKNIQLVIDALKYLPKTSLVLVGARNVFQKKVQQYVKDRNVHQQVHFLGYVDDAALTKLYLESTALVQPSLSEGFGLTGIEALSLDTPVIASDIPIFHEIYAKAATYFNPHSVESFLDAYHQTKKRSQTSFLREAEQVTSEYSWKKMAKLTHRAYHTIHVS